MPQASSDLAGIVISANLRFAVDELRENCDEALDGDPHESTV
jgi:hypothetical protein